MSSIYSIGVDIGGSHITSCMYEHSNNKLYRETLVNLKVDTKGTKEEIIKTWAYAVTKTISLSGTKNIKGIGIAMPGPFNYFQGISLIKGVDKLESLYKINIREEFASELKIHPSSIRFINDASAFSIAEALVGKASTYKRSVSITLGTGFGSSFLINGQPIVVGNQVPNGGFLYNHYHEGKLADAVFSTRGIINRYMETSGIKIKNVRELCDRIPEDEAAIAVFKWFGAELSKFLKPYLTNFEAEVLIVGGNIAKAYRYFCEDLMQQLPGLDIFVSDFGEEAAIIGSALLLKDDYYSELKPTLKLM